MSDIRYPIGKFDFSSIVSPVTDEQIAAWIDGIELVPRNLHKAVVNLSEEQLNTPYREGGWTVRQVVHHLPDSHMNTYIRFKFALTEVDPAIKPFPEDKWAELPDSKGPIAVSLTLLDALHERWVSLMRAMTREDFDRSYVHPQLQKVTLAQTAALFAWHGQHHIAHITSLRERMHW